MTCKVTTTIEINNADDAELPDKLRSKVRFYIEATAVHHYESASAMCDGEDWVEVEDVPYLFVEFDRPSVDGVVTGWYEWEIRDNDAARRYLAAWGVDVDELATEDWVGKDSYADAMGADVDAAYDKYHDDQNDW